MFTRAQYMNGDCSHQEYYMQFVNPQLQDSVIHAIGANRIMQSTDLHFNDIPLKYWDNLYMLIFASVNRGDLIMAKEGKSLSTAVCIAKAAARNFKGKQCKND